MPMRTGQKIDKEDPEFLERKAKREAKAAEKKKKASAILDDNVDPRIRGLREGIALDEEIERSLSDHTNVHLPVTDKNYDKISKKWTLTIVPYVIIYAIMYNINTRLVKEMPNMEIDFESPGSIVDRQNVGAVRVLVQLYSNANPEIILSMDLQYYVNQVLRNQVQMNKPRLELYLQSAKQRELFPPTQVVYDGKPLTTVDIATQVDNFFTLSNNLEIYTNIYKELVGQNRINSCYNSLQPDFAWTLDLTYFLFSDFSIWVFVALDLATRKIMHWDFFTTKDNPNGIALFTSLKKAFKKHKIEPQVLHTDQAGYFLGNFDDLFRKEYPSIQLSKTKYGMVKSRKTNHQNQAVEAFFSSFKKTITKDLGKDFFANTTKPQDAISALRQQLQNFNQSKIHRVLLNTPHQDHLNKVILECIRLSYNGAGVDSLTPEEIDDLLKSNNLVESNNVIDATVVSDLPAVKSENASSNEIAFIETTGRILDQTTFNQSVNSGTVASPKIQKLVKQQVVVSSGIIINSLQIPENIRKIIQEGLSQFPKSFFDQNLDQDFDFLYSEDLSNAFYFAIKQHVLSGPNLDTPLAAYLQNRLPDLIRGPGKLQQYEDNYLQFLDIQINLDRIIQNVWRVYYVFAMRVQAVFISKRSEAQSQLQLMEHKRTQDLIIESKNEMSRKITTLEDELKNVTFELQERNRVEREAREAKEKRKNYNRLPPRDAVSEQEFVRLLEHCSKMVQVDNSETTRYKAGFMKMSYFLLMVTGMRVSNLLYVKNRDISRLINETSNTIIDVPLIKTNERKFIQIAIDKQIRKIFLVNEPYNISRDFLKMQDRLGDFLGGKGASETDSSDLPYACSFSTPDKPVSREYLNKMLNEGLTAINVDKFGNPLSTPPKTTHSFRVGVIDKITQNYGIEVARDFVNHSDISTTDRYVRSKLDSKLRRDITKSLLNLGKKPKSDSSSNEDESVTDDSQDA